jgi:hypothetical protein
MRYRQMGTISGKGTGPGQFSAVLRGVGVDQTGIVYAVGDDEVKVFDADGNLRRRWKTARPGYCVAVDDEGTVYVGEEGQIEQFDAAGRNVATWQDADRLGLVTAICFYGDAVLIADAKDRCIRRYDARGNWINNIGKDNNTRGFLIPNGVLDFRVDGA